MRIGCGLLVLSMVGAGCNNYGLLDQVEAPGKTSGTSGSASLRLYAFVTNQTTLGDMTGLTNGGCSGNSFARADCACTDLAVANGLQRKPGGLFRAWLSGVNDDMTCRLQGLGGNNCGLPSGTYTWYNTNDELIASSYGDLFDGAINFGIKYSETKALISGQTVWTGTDSNGLRTNGGGAASNCNSWTDNTTTATTPARGFTGATNASWSNDSAGANCSESNYVMCFAVP